MAKIIRDSFGISLYVTVHTKLIYLGDSLSDTQCNERNNSPRLLKLINLFTRWTNINSKS